MEDIVHEMEKRLEKLNLMTSKMQWAGTICILIIFATRSAIHDVYPAYDYTFAGQTLAILLLIWSFVVKSMYAQAWNKLKELKNDQEEGGSGRIGEYMWKFQWPMLFWSICFAIFWWI